MTMLGNIQLSGNLVLDGIDDATPIAYSQRRTILGESVLQTAPMVGGRNLVLRGDNHFRHADIVAIQDLARQGSPVTLIHHRGTFHVQIVSVDPEPVFDYADPCDDAWYSGSITMIEV